MAEIVLGIGTSHTPMLFTPPDLWPEYEARDRRAELLDRDGRPCRFDELLSRRHRDLDRASFEKNYRRCQEALDRLARVLEEAAPDAVVVIGDDQKELFQEDNLPAILVFRGESLVNKKRLPKPGEPSWWSDALAQYYGRSEDELHPVEAKLARHLIESLIENEFDVAQSDALPQGHGEGHAFAFVHSRLLRHRPVPVVPVFLNTYYPPNQPTPRRCVRLGRAIRRAVESFPGNSRVAVVGSGGLSHFVVDEELDQLVLGALADDDVETLTSLPQAKLHSGTSEIRNWLAMYGASSHLSHGWTDYVPAYRTSAGTGTGCAFAFWR
jgi:3-O-methylgallate 3,4-dioxygenase